MDDYDITGLDPQSAREYVLAVITTLKQTKTKRTELEKEYQLWTGRVKLAEQNGRADLQSQAEVRVFEVKQDLDRIKAEEASLAGGVIRLKSQLSMLQSQPQFTVDTDRMLAELELLGDHRDELADKFKDEEAEIALQNLKNQLNSEEKDS